LSGHIFGEIAGEGKSRPAAAFDCDLAKAENIVMTDSVS
jgi:hypothetical protein